MRTYIVILSAIPNKAADEKFAAYIEKNKFDFWRYTALTWIVITPDNVSTNMLNAAVYEAYRVPFVCCLEVTINDVAGIWATSNDPLLNPFQWFKTIKERGYVPRWEKEKTSTK